MGAGSRARPHAAQQCSSPAAALQVWLWGEGVEVGTAALLLPHLHAGPSRLSMERNKPKTTLFLQTQKFILIPAAAIPPGKFEVVQKIKIKKIIKKKIK